MKHILHQLFVICVFCSFFGCKSEIGDTPENEWLSFLIESEKPNLHIAHFDSMPPGGRKLKVNFKGSLARAFNDSNHHHLRSASSIGIEPITYVSDIWNITQPIRKIKTDSIIFVDNLTHSLPYLVSTAADLLYEIGRSFRDSLQARGGGDYRIKVTSLLRTPSSVAKLRKRNRNAVESSAHRFATTFDISYAKFICNTPNIPRTQEDMKNLLAEILQNLQQQGRCYVKYERKQGCFHITARPVNQSANNSIDER